MIIFGVDPGLANSGVAVLVDGYLASLTVYSSVPSIPRTKRRKKQTFTLAQRLAAHVDVARLTHRADVLAIEVPSYPPGARAAGMLFASFGVWCGATSSACEIVMYQTKAWRAAHGLSSRETAAERKDDAEDAMLQRWPEAMDMMDRILKSKREHGWDALAIATAAWDARR